jgi:hypothetical protein
MTTSDLIGILGGVAGILALVNQGYTMWQNRLPKLVMFIPFAIIGDQAKERHLILLVRLANTSERPANMYLETLHSEVFSDGQWHHAPIVIFAANAKISFDLPPEIQRQSGVKDIKFFEIFDNALITLDHPYSRYLVLSPKNVPILEKVERLRIKLRDCNLHEHVVEAEVQRDRKKWL